MKLHLGSGGHILKGWDNLDKNPAPGVIQADLTKKLQYPNDSVDFIYSQHFWEHIDENQGVALLRECYRVLKKNGVIRIVTPDLDLYVDAYLNWHKYKETKKEFSSPEQFLNYAMIGEAIKDKHRFIYNKKDLREKAIKVGFSEIKEKEYGNSDHKELKNLETRGRHILQLIIELVK